MPLDPETILQGAFELAEELMHNLASGVLEKYQAQMLATQVLLYQQIRSATGLPDKVTISPSLLPLSSSKELDTKTPFGLFDGFEYKQAKLLEVVGDFLKVQYFHRDDPCMVSIEEVCIQDRPRLKSIMDKHKEALMRDCYFEESEKPSQKKISSEVNLQ